MKINIFVFFIFQKIISLVQHLLAILLGEEECVCCSRLSGAIPLCKTCKQNLFLESKIDTKRCSVCGKVLISEINICYNCRFVPVLTNIEKSFPMFSYRLWKKNLLFAWKSENKRVLSPLFAEFVYNHFISVVKSLGLDNNIPIVPIPPRPNKIKNKGWDQIDELCYYLKKMYGLKVLPILRRLTKIQQKKLDRKQRLNQIIKSYTLKNKNILKKYLKNIPEQVFLIDDVITTGSTINSCAALLKGIGIKKVYDISIFIVD